MALTPEQIQVINKFKEKYFDKVSLIVDSDNIPISEFMDKTKAQQIDFIKTWTVNEHAKLITLEGNLTAQQGRVATLKEIARKALEDWGIIV